MALPCGHESGMGDSVFYCLECKDLIDKERLRSLLFLAERVAIEQCPCAGQGAGDKVHAEFGCIHDHARLLIAEGRSDEVNGA